MSEDCIHYYELPFPDGYTSLGKCRKCGHEKEHYNSNASFDGSWKDTAVRKHTWVQKEQELLAKESEKDEQRKTDNVSRTQESS